MSRARHTARAPMLVLRGLANDKLETRERMAVEAFALGYADAEHFDALAQMQGMLILAGSTSEKRKPAMLYARNVLGNAMESIRARHTQTGKLDATPDELKVLRGFVSMYIDFWKRQPSELYESAIVALHKFHEKVNAERAQQIEKLEAA